MRQRYKMSDEQHTRLLEACKPVPYMVIGGVESRSPQENANAAWQALGREMGFVWDSVRPDGADTHYFTAEPVPDDGKGE